MKHILIVEDEPNLRDSIADQLNYLGYKTTLANDGIQGFSLAKKCKPDLIISDIVMPNINGFNLLSLVRDDREIQHTPFIFLSAKVERDDRREGMGLGADDFLTKPFSHNDLATAIESRFKRFQVLQTAFTPDKAPEVVEEQKTDKLAIPTLDGIDFINFDDIVYGEAKRSYACFHLMSGKKVLVSKALKEFEAPLVASFFCRVHRSYIVNMKYVKKYVRGKGGYLILTNELNVPVSAGRKDQLLDKLDLRRA